MTDGFEHQDLRRFYMLAPEGDYYEGQVLRMVERRLGAQPVITSAVSTGLTLEEFRKLNPKEPVDGVSGQDTFNLLRGMSDEDLGALGLSRIEGFEPEASAEREEEILKPTFHYPISIGFGNYKTSDDQVFSRQAGGKEAAIAHQKVLDNIGASDGGNENTDGESG